MPTTLISRNAEQLNKIPTLLCSWHVQQGMMPLVLCPNSQNCWFLGKNRFNFVSPAWKFDNPYYHTSQRWFWLTPQVTSKKPSPVSHKIAQPSCFYLPESCFRIAILKVTQINYVSRMNITLEQIWILTGCVKRQNIAGHLFDQLLKLHYSLDAYPEIQILNWL